MYSPNNPIPTNWAPIKVNNTANRVNTPSAAHTGPNSKRMATNMTERVKPEMAITLPTTLNNQRRGGQTGNQVVHQIDQFKQAVFRVAELTFGVGHLNFRGAPGKRICQYRNKSAAFMAMQHSVHHLSTISPQHAAVIAHGFAGGALNHHINHA